MNPSEFAVNILRKYAEENGEIVRGTTDTSPLEQWLIMQMYKETNAKPAVNVKFEDIETIIKENDRNVELPQEIKEAIEGGETNVVLDYINWLCWFTRYDILSKIKTFMEK